MKDKATQNDMEPGDCSTLKEEVKTAIHNIFEKLVHVLFI